MRKGYVIWLTGLPCSGKTSIGDNLADKMKNYLVERLDGDIVRKSLTKDLGFSKEDRKINLERVTFVAKLLSRNGILVICSFVSPYREVREYIKKETTNFIEVYVKTSTAECVKRDNKGMWAKAKRGEIKGFTGFDAPYEIPINPDIIVNTEKETIEESTQKILNYLIKRIK